MFKWIQELFEQPTPTLYPIIERLKVKSITKGGDEAKLNKNSIQTIERIIFNDPATIVKWSDGTKTIVKVCEGDTFDYIQGVQQAIIKKMFGSNRKIKKLIREKSNASKIIVKKLRLDLKKIDSEMKLEAELEESAEQLKSNNFKVIVTSREEESISDREEWADILYNNITATDGEG